MGCDIHVHIEIKVGGQWHHYDQPNIGRFYALFEKIAGVRGYVDKAISRPRGLPEDATFTTLFDYKRWGVDAHSATWLSCQEIGELEEWWENQPEGRSRLSFNHDQIGYLFGNSFGGFLIYPRDYPAKLEDARMICWFDN